MKELANDSADMVLANPSYFNIKDYSKKMDIKQSKYK
jgi:DNA modification methylase